MSISFAWRDDQALPAPFDLAWLDTLAVVAESGSFTQAGLRLHLTQSAVSQQVAALERWAGAPLLHRRPVALTDAGQLVLTHHQTLRARVARLGEDLVDLRQGLLGTVRIAAFLSACRTLVPAALTAFRRATPRVRVVLSQLETGPALTALRHGDVDLAVVFGYGPVEMGGELAATPLYDEPVVLAVPVGHPLAAGPAVDLTAVDPAEVIVAPDASMPSVGSGAAARVRYLGDDFSVLLALVAAGQGVAPVPWLAVTPCPAGVALVRLAGPEQPRRRVWAVWSAGQEQRPEVTAAVRALVTAGAAASPGQERPVGGPPVDKPLQSTPIPEI
ncbi:LysR family transcriptional regulator [Plantactinospora sonchi]|uniref:LysR family transcriptional regulator n=1 Tax=Plantactinospora sonchi TaxID=1544735 RepID=A0ABU7S597_9ACTN